MPKVICTRPNASTLISGVKFEPHDIGVISEEISQEKAAEFLSISGYVLAGSKPVKDDAAEKAGIEALQEKARALGIDVSTRWKEERLTAEIERAEAAAKSAEGNTENE